MEHEDKTYRLANLVDLFEALLRIAEAGVKLLVCSIFNEDLIKWLLGMLGS